MDRALRWLLVVWLLLCVQSAYAQPSAPAERLLVSASDGALAPLSISVDRLVVLIGIETKLEVVTEGEAPLRAYVDPADDRESVAVTFTAETKTDSRVVALGDVAAGERARVVALALSEMIRARRHATVEAPPAAALSAPAPPEPSHPVQPREPVAPPRKPTSRSFELTAGPLWFAQRKNVALDWRGAFDVQLRRPFWLRGEIGLAIGRSGTAADHVELVVPSLALGMRVRSNPDAVLSVGAGPVFDTGLAFVQGTAEARSRGPTRVLVFRSALEGDVRLRLIGRVYAVLGASFGVMLRDVERRTSSGETFGAAGLALGARLGVGGTF